MRALAALGLSLMLVGHADSQWGSRGCGPVGVAGKLLNPPGMRAASLAPAASPYNPVPQAAYRPDQALIRLELDDGSAIITVGGEPTISTGRIRHFVTPSLPPGPCKYEIVARWGELEERRTAVVRRGATALLRLERPWRDDTGPDAGTVAQITDDRVIPDTPNLPTGVDQSKLLDRERTLIDGVEVPTKRGIEAIESDVPNYASKFRVLVIDHDAARRAQVRGELAPHPECQDSIVSAYAPDHWHLRDRDGQLRFHVVGSPVVCLLAPDGQELHRQHDWDGGVGAAVEAFRRAKKDYDPKKTPDRRKPEPIPTPAPKPEPNPSPVQIPGWLLIASGAAAILFFFRRQT